MAEDRGIVWVLGAGFSKALGGPLLKDLLSEASGKDTALRYFGIRSLEFENIDNARARWVYQYGHRANVHTGIVRRLDADNIPVIGEPLWENAEDFLEYLDLAASEENGAEGVRSTRLVDLQIEAGGGNSIVRPVTLRECARRLVAAECSGFLVGADPSTEKWRPFRRWASELSPGDTVVTFNYDLVLEQLIEAQDAAATSQLGAGPRSVMKVVLPSPAIKREELRDSCPVLKLHGSVNWTKVFTDGNPSRVRKAPAEETVLDGEARFMAIATPGPTKMQEAFGFKSLWDLGCERIRSAEAVVFLGFRFPETDAHPREVLLGAIAAHHAKSGNAPSFVRFHVVLGPVGSDTQRLESLLNFVGPRNADGDRRFDVTVHPLYGQDFLTVATRGHLLERRPNRRL